VDEEEALLCRSSSQTAAAIGNRGGQHCERCFGIGCCKAPIPLGMGCDSYDVSVKGTGNSNYSVLIAEEAWFHHLNVTLSMALREAGKTRIPVVLAWAVVVGSDDARAARAKRSDARRQRDVPSRRWVPQQFQLLHTCCCPSKL
jgi:hypothetical protein